MVCYTTSQGIMKREEFWVAFNFSCSTACGRIQLCFGYEAYVLIDTVLIA